MKLTTEEMDTLRELATLDPDEREAMRASIAPVVARKRQLREAEAKIAAKEAEVRELQAKLPELQQLHQAGLLKVYESSRLLYQAMGDAREMKAKFGAAVEAVTIATNVVQGMRTGLAAQRRDDHGR